LTIGGLTPDTPYIAKIGEDFAFRANVSGEARLNLPLADRTELKITRAA